ncbi:MAG: PorP/SprF family type IX secretion system membrane protein, partial [Urechidicola sp.]|nr:PorP/SprF family type IX secretion system membrane protein [Urechidicola sp.]
YNIENRFTPVIGAGAYLFNNTWYAGISIPNFLETKHYDDSSISNATEKSNLYFISGYVFDISEIMKFKPAILGKFTLNAPVAIDITANFLFYDKLTLGAAYRTDAAVSALVAFQISNQLLISYGYDYETTNIGNFSSGSHEFILRYDVFDSSFRMVSPRFF